MATNSKGKATFRLLNSDFSRKPAFGVSRPNGSLNSSIVNRLNRFEFPRNKPKSFNLSLSKNVIYTCHFAAKLLVAVRWNVGFEFRKKNQIFRPSFIIYLHINCFLVKPYFVCRQLFLEPSIFLNSEIINIFINDEMFFS